jgi:hypothetical protein
MTPDTPSTEALTPEEPLGPCCDDLTCSWQPIPHVHEGSGVYPAPPDRIEWVAALATSEDTPHD